MANTLAPFGFREYQGGSGGAPTFAQSEYKIASTNGTAIFFGDAVSPVVSSATGYITQATAGSTGITGIFVGCTYISVAQKRRVWSNYWPGSDANGDVSAYVIDDPNATFLVQSSWSSPLFTSLTTQGTSPVGQYCQLTVGTGTTANGQSGMYVSSLGTTVTFPFIVRSVITFPPGVNGNDPTTQYYNVVVGFNNALLRTNGAGPTGIS